MQRNQMIGLVLMVVMMLVWAQFFWPSPPEMPPADAPVATVAQDAAPPAPVAALAGATPPAIAAADLPPPAAPPQQSAEDEIALVNENLELVFTRVGARLKGARVLLGENNALSQELVPHTDPLKPDAEQVLPLGLRFSPAYLGDALDQSRWEAQPSPDGRSLTFTIDVPGKARIEKHFSLPETGHLIQARVSYSNATATPQVIGGDRDDPAFALNWAPNITSGDLLKGLHQELIWHRNDENVIMPVTDLQDLPELKNYSRWLNGIEWSGLASAYFLVAIKPEFTDASGWASGTSAAFRFGVGVPRFEVAAGATESRDYQLYIGPKDKPSLRSAWEGLDTTWVFFETFIWSKSLGSVMDVFAKVLLAILHWFHDNIYANYGFAIIFLTLLVRIVVFPLTMKSMVSMKQMQKLAPEMEKIKEETKDNPQEQQKRMMELYRERGVNPLSGCFPLLLQMPVFFALYRMLWTAFELRGAHFAWWITDLSEPDRLFVLSTPIPLLFGQLESINLLPLLMAVVMWGSTKVMPVTGPGMSPEQKMVMNIMPVMFSVFCYSQAAGLSLYIITSTVLGMLQTLIVHRIDWKVDVDKKPKKETANRPKHWYNAAQAKKRETAKLERRQKEKRGNGPSGEPKVKKK